MDVKQQALEALIEASNLFDNYPQLYECIGTYEVIVSAINALAKKESTMPNYEMFTDEGNADVHKIVEAIKVLGLTWAETYQLLARLAKMPNRGEATDTAVRECVYEAIGAFEREESFYI